MTGLQDEELGEIHAQDDDIKAESEDDQKKDLIQNFSSRSSKRLQLGKWKLWVLRHHGDYARDMKYYNRRTVSKQQ